MAVCVQKFKFSLFNNDDCDTYNIRMYCYCTIKNLLLLILVLLNVTEGSVRDGLHIYL